MSGKLDTAIEAVLGAFEQDFNSEDALKLAQAADILVNLKVQISKEN